MKRIIITCTMFLLLGCTKNIEKIEILRFEGGQTINLTIEEFDEKIKSEENFVSFITVEGLADCGCSDTEAKLIDYSMKNNFSIYRISLDLKSENYIERYQYLLDVTAEEGVKMIPELETNDQGQTITPLLPRLLVYSLGYLAVNTNKDFEKKLDTYIKIV